MVVDCGRAIAKRKVCAEPLQSLYLCAASIAAWVMRKGPEHPGKRNEKEKRLYLSGAGEE